MAHITHSIKADVLQSWPNRVGLMLCLAVLNAGAGLLGLQLAVPPGYATVIWPPSGIAVAALLVFGPWMWPGIFLGSLAVNLHIGGAFAGEAFAWPAFWTAAAIAAGSTLQALVTLRVLWRLFGRPISLRSWGELGWAMALAGPLCCTIAATIGTATLFAAGVLPASASLQNWATWWAGDILGVVVFLPLSLMAPGIRTPVEFKSSRVRGFSPLSVLSVLLPLAISFYSFILLSNIYHERAVTAFNTLAYDNLFALETRFAKYEQALDAGVALFHGSDSVTLEEWERYFETARLMQNLPGINGMGMIEYVPEGERAAFLDQARRDGVPGLEIKREGPELFVIKYILPIEPNREALGLNIAFEQGRYEAAIRAAETGFATITRRIILVQDETRSAGFLIMEPIYAEGASLQTAEDRRAALEGWVYAPLVSHRFLSDLTQRQGQDFRLRVYDGPTPDPETLIFDSDADRGEDTSLYQAVETIETMGVEWTLVWNSLPAFEKRNGTYLPFVLLGLGLVVSGLSGSLLMSYMRREDMIGAQVRKQTRVIAARERLSQSLLDTSEGVILMVDDTGVIRRSNRYAEDLFAHEESDTLVRQDLAQTVPGLTLARLRALSAGDGAAQEPADPDTTFRVRVDGRIRLFNVRVTSWSDQRGKRQYTVLGDDVTLQHEQAQALETTNRRWTTALAGSGIGVFDIDLATGVSIVNDTWWHTLGLAPSDADPQSVFLERVHPDDLTRLRENDRRCLSGETPLSVTELRIRHADGGWRWLRAHATVFTRDASGRALRLIGTQLDITALKVAEAELQKSLETFRIAHEGAPVGIALIDECGRLSRVNPALCRLARTGQDELLATARDALTVPEDRPIVTEAIAAALSGTTESIACEWRMVRAGADPVWVRSTIALVKSPEGDKRLLVESFEDIDAAREVDRLKSEFVSTVSHELRTPLTAVRGALGLLKATAGSTLPAKPANLLDIASRNCEQLIHLVNDILDMEKLASGKMEFFPEPHVVDTLLRQALEENATYATERNVKTEADFGCGDLAVEVDHVRTRQVLSNLLSNAVKFSERDSTIHVRSTVRGDRIRIEVSDTGPGIPPDMQDSIFDRFHQIRRSEMEKQSGSGLGLYISRMIITAMRGEIGVSSTVGEGSTFWIELPRA